MGYGPAVMDHAKVHVNQERCAGRQSAARPFAALPVLAAVSAAAWTLGGAGVAALYVAMGAAT